MQLTGNLIPEIGQYCLVLALCLAIAQTALPTLGIWLKAPSLITSAKTAARSQFGLLVLAFLCLSYAFVVNDFSVSYVVNNSNTLLPLRYRLAAVWGAHEGSLLLWVLMIAGWTAALSWWSRDVPENFLARVLAVQGTVSIGFLLFLIFTSNPFSRRIPVAAEGSDFAARPRTHFSSPAALHGICGIFSRFFVCSGSSD